MIAGLYEILHTHGIAAIRCGLCDRISESRFEVERRYCARCRLFFDAVEQARKLHAEGATHECSEWTTWRGACAVCGRRDLRQLR